MSKELKTFNPLSLDIDRDEPTFVNDAGTKWWLICRGSHMSDTPDKDPETVWRIRTKDGVDDYVVLSGEEPVYNSGNLENVLFKVDELYLGRTM